MMPETSPPTPVDPPETVPVEVPQEEVKQGDKHQAG